VRLAVVVIVGAVGAIGSLLLGAGTASAPATAPPAATPRAAAPACVPMTPGTHRLPSIDGRIPVVLHVGRKARPGAPLVIGLPGAGQTARDFAAYTGYSKLADRGGFSVAYPTATGSRPFWNMSGAVPGKPDDVAYLRKVIPAAVRAACANPAHVGVTGVSNGGGMAARMACDAADLIAAAAPVAGGYKSLPSCQPSRPVAILEIHGAADHVVPYRGDRTGAGSVPAFLSQWRRLDGCRGAARRLALRANVVELRWSHCAGGAVVQHDRIADADHGWPGENDVDGAREFASTHRTWAFLRAFGR
jgi:polyhydroxybutyrate depolymerase